MSRDRGGDVSFSQGELSGVSQSQGQGLVPVQCCPL